MLYIEFPAWIKPEIISGLPLRWYSLAYLLAFLITYLIASHLCKIYYKDFNSQLSNLFVWMIFGIIIGARIFSKLIYSQEWSLLYQPWLMFWPFDSSGQFVGIQGLSYHGGLIGMLVASLIFTRVKRYKFSRIVDIIAVSAPLGYTLGRLGNFINGELYGRITTASWGIVFPRAEQLPYGDSRIKEVADSLQIEPAATGLVNLPRHPSQLYEAFFEGIVCFAILYCLYRLIANSKYYFYGFFSALYIMLYSTARFIIEYFRQPDANLDFVLRFSENNSPRWFLNSLLNFSTGQVLSMIAILFSIVWMVWAFHSHSSGKSALLNRMR